MTSDCYGSKGFCVWLLLLMATACFCGVDCLGLTFDTMVLLCYVLPGMAVLAVVSGMLCIHMLVAGRRSFDHQGGSRWILCAACALALAAWTSTATNHAPLDLPGGVEDNI
jgi:hypothetical protein